MKKTGLGSLVDEYGICRVWLAMELMWLTFVLGAGFPLWLAYKVFFVWLP